MADAAQADSAANAQDSGIFGLTGLFDSTSPFAAAASPYAAPVNPYGSSMPAQGFQGQRLTDTQAQTYVPSVYHPQYIDYTQPGAIEQGVSASKPTQQSISSFYGQNQNNPQTIANYASYYGLTSQDLAGATGLSQNDINTYLGSTTGIRPNYQGGVELRDIYAPSGGANQTGGGQSNAPYVPNYYDYITNQWTGGSGTGQGQGQGTGQGQAWTGVSTKIGRAHV